VESGNVALRDTLFGDLPVERWPPADTSTDGYPWDVFVEARTQLAAGAVDDAKRCWRDIAGHPGLESRHYLQAWHFLRERGELPAPDIAKQVLAIVVEMGLPEGLDLLAAYADGGVRYYNHAGGGVVVDDAQGSLAERVAALLAVSSEAVKHIGPSEEARPGPPPPGSARLSFLTPSGPHFGEGPVEALEADPLAGAILGSATAVLNELTSIQSPG
jgi:hypothetical protein